MQQPDEKTPIGHAVSVSYALVDAATRLDGVQEEGS